MRVLVAMKVGEDGVGYSIPEDGVEYSRPEGRGGWCGIFETGG